MAQTAVSELIADLGKIPPELRRALRPALRRAVEPVRKDAQRRASWSTRIPDAIKVQTTLAGKRSGVALVVRSKKAPHARPYENLGRHGIFRHPVFGNEEAWVSQAARPFLFPAAYAAADRVAKDVADTVDYVARLHGFR